MLLFILLFGDIVKIQNKIATDSRAIRMIFVRGLQPFPTGELLKKKKVLLIASYSF